MRSRFLATVVVLALFTLSLSAQETYKPFIRSTLKVADAKELMKQLHEVSDIKCLGHYDPAPGYTVLTLTTEEMMQRASESENGEFGAAVRILVRERSNGLEISYTDLNYWAHAYRWKSMPTETAKLLKKVLKGGSSFGSEEGLSSRELRKYHYTFGMPYFDDEILLAEYSSQMLALEHIEKGLEAGKAGLSKVYRLDIPAGKCTVFGVAIGEGSGGDGHILKTIDLSTPSHGAHLPYEILVRDGKIYTLPAKFRIAISWPDLTMMGEGSFASIMSAPGGIEGALEELAE